MNLNFKINYFQISENDKSPMINIKGDSFDYGNIYGMYKTESTQGHGIQVNDLKLEKPLKLMCDKISQTIYDFQKEINEL
jgi:predicted oxidoreductase